MNRDLERLAPDLEAPDAASRKRLVVGAALMLAGVVLMALLHGWGGEWLIRLLRALGRGWWPVVPLTFGLLRIAFPGSDRGRRRPRSGGAWLVLVGVWGLISEFRLFGLSYSTSWPLLIVAAGLVIVWRALEDSRSAGRTQEQRHG